MVNQIELKSKFEFFRKNNIVYLDNAATTQVPDSVVNSVNSILEYRGNPHRGAHLVAEFNGKLLDESRENVAKFINSSSEEIVFTNNTTDSINLASDLIASIIEKGDEIVIPVSEHHSNILPFDKLVKLGAKIKVANLKDSKVDLGDLKKKITKKTKVVVLGHISNVLGSLNPVEELGNYLKKNYPKIVYVVDGAQAVAHVPVDVKKIKCDFYAFSSHKMYGPCGVGVLFVSKEIFNLLKPLRAGGGTVKGVHFVKEGDNFDLVVDLKKDLTILEGGTPNTSNIVGLSKAVNFIRSVGFDFVEEHEKELITQLLNGLKKIEGIKIYGSDKAEKGKSLVSFSLEDIPTNEVGEQLDKRKICIRHGSHCAFPLIDYLGKETLRVSLGVYNDESDIDTFLQELKLIIDKKRGLIKNKNLEILREKNYYKNMFVVNSKEQILEKIKASFYEKKDTEIIIMAGHFLGIPDLETNTFYPSIKSMIPERLHCLLNEFGMTSFPIYTWDFGCQIVSDLKKEGYNAKLSIIANDTTGINELRLSPANKQNKTAEQYEKEFLEKFGVKSLPENYKVILNKYGLNEKDLLENQGKITFDEKGLRARFKTFIDQNKEYFDGVLNYTMLKDGSWDLSINLIDNQEIKTCRFDTFNSKTGGKFCIVEVCQFIAELFGKAKETDFNYTSERVLNPKSQAKHKVLVMLTPAMCDDAVSSGAQLYIKLMLQEKAEGSFKFFNVPLGPDSSRYLATGATIKYLSDKDALEEINAEKEPDFPVLWRTCEEKLLYDAESYTDEIEDLFKKVGINKKSSILDTCVGPGFFCINLLKRGYNLKTADKSKTMIKPFEEELKEKGIKHKTIISKWLDLEKHFKKNSLDFMFNRGNTFIYSGGGWNENIKIDKKKFIDSYKKTLKIYYHLLKKGGYLYIDKFKDSEIPAKKVVAKLNIKNPKKQEDIIFYVEKRPEQGTRWAQMLLRDSEGNEKGLPNIAYDLTEDEMEDLLKEAGFKSIERLKLKNERHFVVWLAKK